jgi:uncharacterized protein YndB with AHSA1/START domain
MPKVAAIRRSTGKERHEWFAELDAWGAPGKPYREISDWLTGHHGITRWWAQKIIVEYEQERGLRAPGVRRDGTFEVGASKTVAVPADELFAAFVDPRRRRKWLTDGRMKLQGSVAKRTARFAWDGNGSRVSVELFDKGPDKTNVAVSHQKIATEKEAAAAKLAWRQRLVELKEYLEA